MQGFDDKILSLYARGMTTREIQGHLEEIYQVEVSPTLISNVTDAVIDEVKAWQTRPLDAIYPIVYLDALVVKMRADGRALAGEPGRQPPHLTYFGQPDNPYHLFLVKGSGLFPGTHFHRSRPPPEIRVST